jgi:hypothetical protein
MIRDPQDLADELAAERIYNDTSIPIVDAFDLFDTAPAFDHCDRVRHWAACGRYEPFQRCARAGCRSAHMVDMCDTAYRLVGDCPNGNETVDGAWQACEPPESD